MNDNIDMVPGSSYSKTIMVRQNPFEYKLLKEDIKRFPEFWKNCKSRKMNKNKN